MKTPLFVLLTLLIMASCDSTNFSDTSGEDLFFLENEKAIMPVRVQGNKASNRFVIFLHGGPGGNSIDMPDFLESAMGPIEEEVAMVYWDQRCAGSSQGNCDRRELSFDAYLSDLDQLIILLKGMYGTDIEFYFMTHSFGGWLATIYLSDWDDERNIKGWINIDGAFSAPMIFEASREMLIEVGNRQIDQGNNVEKWQDMITEVEGLDLSNLDDKETLNSLGYQAPQLMVDVDSINANEAEATFSSIMTSPGSQLAIVANNIITAISPFSKDVFSTDHSDKLANVDVPVLLLWGKYDFVVPPSTTLDFERLVGSENVSKVIFERSEHTPFVTEPEKFADVVVEFFRANR